MKQTSAKSALLGLLAFTASANAHTWIEQMMVIAPNGTMVGQPGYARGNVLRSSSGFSDPTMVNLIPPDGREINDILPTDLMCKSTQTSQTQTDGSPALQAAPGSGIALRYQENGHVTLPQNQPGKPSNRGTVYVYGTTQPSPSDSFLAIHRVWNADGTGGDGRGKLLSTQNFDDGQCYQVNGGTISQQRQSEFPHQASSLTGADVWCQQDIQLPSDAQSGQTYTLYWVWDWPTLPGTSGFPDGKQEIYTTCMDVKVTSSGTEDVASSFDFATGQDLNSAAISSEVANIANPTFVTAQTIPFGASATGPAGGSATASAAATTATGSVPAFLSVHVSSTGGPGVETVPITSTVVPIGATFTPVPSGPTGQAQTTNAPQPQQTQQSSAPQVTQQSQSLGGQSIAPTQSTPSQSQGSQSFGGHHSHGGNDGSFTGLQTAAVVTPSAVATTTSAPAVTQAPDVPFVNSTGLVEESQVATVTQTDSVFETQYHTVWNTVFTKRNGTSYPHFPRSPRTLDFVPSSTMEIATSFVTVTVTGGYPMFTTVSPFNNTVYVTVTVTPSSSSKPFLFPALPSTLRIRTSSKEAEPEPSLANPTIITPDGLSFATSTTLPVMTVTVEPTPIITTSPVITVTEDTASVAPTSSDPLTVVSTSTRSVDPKSESSSEAISIPSLTAHLPSTHAEHTTHHKLNVLTSPVTVPLPTQAAELDTTSLDASSSTPCSTTEAVYQLKARNFYRW